MKRKSVLGVLIVAVLVAALAPTGNMTAAAPVPAWEGGQRDTREAISPAAPLATLPVFKLMAPPVDQGTVQGLNRLLPGITNPQIFSDTTHTGSVRFSSVNTETGKSVEQFVAGGGFFATNPTRAFSETKALLDYSPSFVCDFLASKGLFPKGVAPPQAQDCAGQLPYTQTPIYLSVLTPTAGLSGQNSPDLTQAVTMWCR